MVDDLLEEHVFVALDQFRRRAEREMARRAARFTRPLRGSHGRLLGLIPETGIRPSELAADAWISKQAVGIRLREMEELGWITISPDPADRRAVSVKRTAAGTRIRRAAQEAIRGLEAEWAKSVGADRYETFRAVLDELGASDS